MKLLLHCCCGPCSLAVIDKLQEDTAISELAAYFFNPNIHPYREYRARREAWRQALENYNLPAYLDDSYPLEAWLQNVAATPEQRCDYCYQNRLWQIAQKTKELNYDAFTTTLLISPYQNHQQISEFAEQIAVENGLIFYYQDFRPDFRAGQQIALEMGLYKQKYCGCIYSEKARFHK